MEKKQRDNAISIDLKKNNAISMIQSREDPCCSIYSNPFT